MANKFKLGDHVQLTVGGPIMAIDRVNTGGDTYHCVWFGGKKREAAIFHEETLKVASVDDDE